MFKQGNKLGGRKKGSLNKIQSKVKENMTLIVEGNVEEFQRRLNALSDNDFVKAYLNCARYVIPTLKSQEVKMEVRDESAPTWLIELSEEDEDRIEESLK
jgi:hypothetical protein